jgi:hypothetical protein
MMKRIAIYIGIVALVACITGQANAANLVSNGGFEAPDLTGFSYKTYQTSPDGFWSVTNTGTGYLGLPYGIDLVNGYWKGSSGVAGDQSVDIDYETIIYQSLVTVPGQTYLLSFAYANNPDVLPAAGYIKGSVGVIDSAVFIAHPDYHFDDPDFLLNDEMTHNTSTHTSMNFSRYNGVFTAISDSTMLGFAGDLDNTYWGFVVDDVSVNASAVPEPMSLSLLGIGLLGAIGAGFRRKK